MSYLNAVILRMPGTQVPQTPQAINSSGMEVLDEDDDDYKTVYRCWSALIRIMRGPRGQWALQVVVAIFKSAEDDTFKPGDPRVSQLVDIFSDKFTAETPMLLIKPMQNSSHVSVHPRGSWNGSPVDFDIRRQAVHFNINVVRNATQTKASAERLSRQYNALPQAQRSGRAEIMVQAVNTKLTLTMYKLVHAMIHETFHLLITFLGNGTRHTPRNLAIATTRSVTHTFSTEADGRRYEADIGEAGEFGEQLLFGGTVDFYEAPGQTALGIIWPWVSTALGRSEKLSVESIKRLLRAPPNDWTGPLIAGTGEFDTTRRVEGSTRFVASGRVAGAPLTSPFTSPARNSLNTTQVRTHVNGSRPGLSGPPDIIG